MKMKRIITMFLLLTLLVSVLQTANASDWYTYNYNFWGDEVESPDTYSVTNVLFGTDFGEEVGVFKDPDGLYVVDDMVYVCDTGNNRIVELRKKDGAYELVRVIYNLQVSTALADVMKIGDNVTLTMSGPTDIFVLPRTAEERLEIYGEYTGELYVPEAAAPAEEGTTEETGDIAEDAMEGGTAKEDDSDTAAEISEAGSEPDSDDSTVQEDSTSSESEETAPETGEETGETGNESGEETGEETGTETGTETEPVEEPVAVKAENIIAQDLNLDYDFYIADNANHRIIHCDYNLNVIDVIDNPEDDTLSKDFVFFPGKLVVDTANRIYVQATNVNSGLMEFDKAGTFTGYVGANKVDVSIVDKIWRKLQTEEQKNRTEQFVPTEYNNLSLDSRGFIYVTTSTIDDDDLWGGTATPVRKLNSMGSDILVRNGNFFPSGDLDWGTAGSVSGASKFVDVIAFANDTYACLDRTRGRIFIYDFQGNMLCAFGNYGSLSGCFQYPTAMDNLGEYSFLVLDKFGSLTEFSMTDYGAMINDALAEYKVGHYDESAVIWEKVLKFNGNYELAYVGIGRSLLRKGDYEEAMDCFETARDSVNYSKAFKHYREEVVEKYIAYALAILAALIIIPKVVRGVRKLRKEIREA